MSRRIGLILFTLLLTGALSPIAAAAPRLQLEQRCFQQTNFCMSGRIREFWEENGGLPVFGYPIGDQRAEVIEGVAYQAQWFERNRLELHPENARPYDVLIGRIGVDRLKQQGRDWMQFARSAAQTNCRFFSETGHNVCGDILASWHANGLEFDGRSGKTEDENLALYGLPVSDAQQETIQGMTYTVQWFERARFELHPENAPPYNVLLGLLGNEARQSAPAPAAPAPAPAPPARPQAGALSFTDVPADGTVEDEADAVVRIAGAKKLVRNDDQKVTRVVVGDRFSIRVFARLKTAANNDDGADIHDVTFEVNGGDIYERTERNAAYCMFGGGDDKNEQSCTIWSFADHDNHWPNDGAKVDTSDSYTVRIFVRAKDDTKVADWNFQLEVRP